MTGEALGVIGGAIALATLLARWAYQRWNRSTAVERAILSAGQVHAVLESLLPSASAVRATVLEAHNGGELPRLDSPIYSSARYEARADDMPSLLESWRCVPIDAEAIKLLVRIVTSPHVVVRAADLRAGSQLLASYGAHGVKTGLSVALARRTSWWRSVLLPTRRSHWYWLCVDWRQEHDPTTAQINAVRAAADIIRATIYGRAA